MKKTFASFILLSVATSCALVQKKFIAYPDLVENWSYELSKQEPMSYPFLVHYVRGPKTLIYVATNHENSIESPTFKLIERAFKKYQPRFVLLEGFRYERGVSDPKMVKWAKEDGKSGFFKGGETSFSIQQALRHSIPFAGVEIDEISVKKAVLAAGYTEKDLLLFYFIRQVPQFVRSRPNKPEPVQKFYKEFLKRVAEDLEISKDSIPPYGLFLTWYREKNGDDFKVEKITSEVPAPLPNGKLFTQRISAVVGIARDKYAVELIGNTLNQNDSVMVIFGGSHWSTQKKVFEKWFGKPEEIIGF